MAFAAAHATADPTQCEQCHPDAVRQYQASGMGQSISRPGRNHPAGVYSHGFSGTTFRTSSTGKSLVQEIDRGGLSARYEIEYVIGSGNAAFGYLVRVGDALFQSPVTYYTGRRRWGMAPGMEEEADPDFGRPVTAECLWCHAGRPAHVPHSVNRYRDPPVSPESISCDRCHGPVEQHLEEPAAATIFNPARAAPRERDSVCEQCHLGGAIRILNPGSHFGSFRPGDRLEEHWTVFVDQPRSGDTQGRFQVVSHVEQLALSRCATESGDSLWCGTCHNPHEMPADPKRYFSQKCRQCHESALPTDHAGRTGDCISCHMTTRQSHDSGHSAFTDHRISRFPPPDTDAEASLELRPWRPVPAAFRSRNLGIAHVLLGQERGSPEMLRRGLDQLKAVSGSFRSDPALLDALGTALALNGSSRAGLTTLRRAVESGPVGALHFNALAAAWWAVGDDAQATAALEQAIKGEPTLEFSYRMLARVHRELGRSREERATWERLLVARPRLIQARQVLHDLNASR